MKIRLKRIGYTVLFLFILLNIMAAFHAYKFTHFYKDAPEKTEPDKMGFGKKISSLFFGIKSKKSITVDSLSLPHDTIFIKTTDSVQLESWYVKKDSSAKTVLLFHGHGGSKSSLITEANAFYNLGYNVILTDFRAHGNSDGNTCTIGYDEAKDVKAVYDFIIKNNPNEEVVLWGVSMGAAAITKAVNDDTLKVKNIILEMPYSKLQTAVKKRCELMGVPQQPTAFLLTFWGGVENGFWAFDMNPMVYARKIQRPVLLQWGKKDNRVSETETSEIFANISSVKQLVVYENAGHESLLKADSSLWERSVNSFLNK